MIAKLGAQGAHFFLRRPIKPVDTKPVSTSTGSGTAAIYKPPTLQTPPNAAKAVLQQLGTSDQLMENTATGAGTGAGWSSFPISQILPGKTNYLILGGLALALILAYAWDKGKL